MQGRVLLCLLGLLLFIVPTSLCASNAKGRLVPVPVFDPVPPDVTQEFDCKARFAAYEYAKKIQPWLGEGLKEVWDGLELSTRCGKVWMGEQQPLKKAYKPKRYEQGRVFYVDPKKGYDGYGGTSESEAVNTLQKALELSRKVKGEKTIYIRAGTTYLPETLQATTEDNGLTVANYPGEEVFISGGTLLTNLDWRPYKVSDKPVISIYPNQNNVFAQAPFRGDTVSIRFLGNVSNVEACKDACLHFVAPGGSPCRSFTFYTIALGSAYNGQCYGRIDDTWSPTIQNNVVSGRIVRPNIYVADIGHYNIKEMLGLHMPEGKGRAIRARYPDANTETAQYPAGYIMLSNSYLPPKPYPNATTVWIDSPAKDDTVMYTNYNMGVGGSCSIFTPPENLWCSSRYPFFNDGSYFETVSGVVYYNETFVGVNPFEWKKANEAVIHMWQPFHWGMMMYAVDFFSATNLTLGWSYGGFQESRGTKVSFGRGGEWYVENILELLDSPNEFYYDKDTKKLYYFFNETGAPSSDFQLVATHLKTMIQMESSSSDPIKDITFFGINFITSAYTYMDPHGVPSGGDPAMTRNGAIFVEGAERITFDSCNFTRLDGNAIIFSGYNRNNVIKNCRFSWIGESAMVLWGHTDGIDGTSGDQPRGSKILNNWVHEIGILDRQSTGIFMAKSCQTTIKGNIMFNGPRALMTFNDGFGGGTSVSDNLIFNPNRESSDSGVINGWDRIPYLSDVLYGYPSLTPAYTNISSNFFLCNYGSILCVNTDDGCAYYNIHDNFEVYGGHKSDFGGHNKYTYNSIIAFGRDYNQGMCGNFPKSVPHFVDGFYNNTCIQGTSTYYLSYEDCSLTNSTYAGLPIVHSNRLYNKDGIGWAKCSDSILPEIEFQLLGFDQGTQTFTLPSDDEIISWAKALLKF